MKQTRETIPIHSGAHGSELPAGHQKTERSHVAAKAQRLTTQCLAGRVIALLAAVPLILLLFTSLRSGGFRGEMVWLHLALAAAVAVCGAFCFGCRRVTARTGAWGALGGGIVLGSVGFAAGFWRPDLFGWEGNLAPMMGIFVTGPIGFGAGAVLGFGAGCAWAMRSRRTTKSGSGSGASDRKDQPSRRMK